MKKFTAAECYKLPKSFQAFNRTMQKYTSNQCECEIEDDRRCITCEHVITRVPHKVLRTCCSFGGFEVGIHAICNEYKRGPENEEDENQEPQTRNGNTWRKTLRNLREILHRRVK